MGIPAGPIPMGYQLAKDPMTGQILLIPTDHGGQRPPPTPGFGFGGFEALASLPQGMPATSSASQHLHQLMMQQQHMSYMQHQELMQQQLRHGLPPSKPRVPETITVSDDDDEDCSKDKASKTVSEVVTSVSEASNLKKESRLPSPMQIKREIVKTEFKLEPVVISSSEPLSESVHVDVKSEPGPTEQGVSPLDKPVTIKQERQERASLSSEEPLVVAEPSVPSSAGCEIWPAPCPTEPTHYAPITSLPRKEIKSEVPDVAASATLCEDTKLCAEALLFMSERSTPSTCNEHFAADPQEPATDAVDCVRKEPSGFDILFQGLELLVDGSLSAPQLSPIQRLTALAGLDVLCSVTRNDTFEYGLSKGVLDSTGLNMGLLCAITDLDYHNQLNWIDPVAMLKKKINVKKYLSQSSEKEAKDFISMKIKQYTKDHPETLEEEKYDNIKMLAKMMKKIKNMEIMSQLEVDMRLKITELQNNFREKQKALSKLKTPKKRNMKNKKEKQRGPGRPKKKKFPNPKAKMGRPRKHPKVVPKIETQAKTEPEEIKLEKIKLEDEDKEDVEPESSWDCDAPPVLEPQQHCDEVNNENVGNRGNSLLKPPRLTASSPPPQSSKEASVNVDTRNTTLSTLTSKFMKGKANPFANLLSKLAAPPSVAGTGETEQEGEEEEEQEEEEQELEEEHEEEEPEEDTAGGPEEQQEQASSVSETASGEVERSSTSDESSSETGSMMSPTRDCSFQFGKTSKLGYGLETYRHSKKRKADKPKKHSGGSSETIVPKKPKNLFMMMDFQRGFNAKSAEDEYNFDDEDNHPYKSVEFRKESPTPSGKSRESQYQEWTDEDLHSSPVRDTN